MNLSKIAAIDRVKVSTLFGMLALILASCAKGQDKPIRHGVLSYTSKEVFRENEKAQALAVSAAAGDVSEIVRLVAAGAPINFLGQHEIVPLWWAAWAENFEGFSALLDAGADPNLQRTQGQPIMHLIVRITKDPRYLRAALKHGGNPNLRDNTSGETPLFRAVLLNHTEQISILVNAGANLNIQKAVDGWTIPMIAISSNANYKLVYELLEAGADYSLKTTQGKTLADIIELTAIDTDDERYIWREKVLGYLRSKGIKVQLPAQETPRSTKA